uniref:Putative anticoagulant peptide n=1 Tax=Tityus obscurus TaxID=1221240 RepID=A0A1E1WWF2_TITOB
MKSVFILLFLFVILSNLYENQAASLFSCQADEEHVNCLPSCGAPNCDNVLNPYPCTFLRPVCSPGCQCKGGKVYNKQGKCVVQTECFRE